MGLLARTSIITGGLGIGSNPRHLILGLSKLSVLEVVPTPTPMPTPPVSLTPIPTETPTPTPNLPPHGGGAVFGERDEKEEKVLAKIKFRVQIKEKVTTKQINIDVDKHKSYVEVMKKLKNFSWTPKTSKRLNRWK